MLEGDRLIELKLYQNETDKAVNLIQDFWFSHNSYHPSKDEALADLKDWTKHGNEFYFIVKEEEFIGFIHLGSRGDQLDWLEDIFVLPEYQNQGIGSRAISLVEEIVSKYSESLFIETAARNMRALKLYRQLGYDCLNTITIRKDFSGVNHEAISTEKIANLVFEIRKN